MRIAIASDAHGAQRYIDALLDSLPEIGAFCFLGDMDKDAEYLDWGLRERQPGADFHAVAGNNDLFSQRPRTITLWFGEAKVLMAHGHLFRGIRSARGALARQAQRDGCALAIYGHTHIARDETINGVRVVNPGALQDGRWALISAEEGKPIKIEFMKLGE